MNLKLCTSFTNLFLLSAIILKFIYVVKCNNILFFWVMSSTQWQYKVTYGWMLQLFPVYGYKNKALWTFMFMSLCKNVFWLFCYTTSTAMNGLYGRYVFNISRSCQILMQNVCAYLNFQQQCIRVPVNSLPYWHWVRSIFELPYQIHSHILLLIFISLILT